MSPIPASVEHIIEVAIQLGSLASLCQGYKGATCLLRAVRSNNAHLVRVLLQHGANPNYNRQGPGKENLQQWRQNPRHTDRAIDNGNAEILGLLLQHAAHVGDCNTLFGTSLNNLLLYPYKSREIKLIICRMLVEHAKKETNEGGTSIFLQTTLEQSMVLNGKEGFALLLEAGVEPRGTDMLYRAIRKNTMDICQLLLQYGANPFLEEPEEQQHTEGAGLVYTSATTKAPPAPPRSPFHAAARLKDTRILELFLKHWKCGKYTNDADGDEYYPVQILYHDDPNNVSLEAVKIIVAHACQADTLMKAHGEHRLFPLQNAATSNASLDVIFLLLKHCPISLVGHQLPSSVRNDDN